MFRRELDTVKNSGQTTAGSKTAGSGTNRKSQICSRGMTKPIRVAIAIVMGRPKPTPSNGFRKTSRPMTTNIGDEKSRIPTFKNNEDQLCPWLIAIGRAVTSSKIGDQKLDPDVQPVRHYAASRHRVQQSQPGSRQAGVGDSRPFRLAPFALGNLILMCLMCA